MHRATRGRRWARAERGSGAVRPPCGHRAARVRHAVDALSGKEQTDHASEHMTNASLIHNMMDTVHHGRVTLIDDPSYADLHCDHYHLPRQWVPKREMQVRGI